MYFLNFSLGNLFVGDIHKQICMNICTFNDHYFNRLLDNLSRSADKEIILLGDFKIALLNFDTSVHFSTFLDDLVSNLLQSQILLPTRISKNIKNLVHNIFYKIKKNIGVVGSKRQVIQTFYQVYWIIFHNSSYYQNIFSNSIPTKYNSIFDDRKTLLTIISRQFLKKKWNQALPIN